jgi:hypothetical protein
MEAESSGLWVRYFEGMIQFNMELLRLVFLQMMNISRIRLNGIRTLLIVSIFSLGLGGLKLLQVVNQRRFQERLK